MVRTVTIPRWFDAHVHLRTDEMLRRVLFYTLRYLSYATVMPNPKPTHPVLSVTDMIRYREEIDAEIERHLLNSCKAVMTCQLTHTTAPDMITESLDAGVAGYKMFPRGVTNAEFGITDYFSKQMLLAYERLEEKDGILLSHCEFPGVDWIDAESRFMDIVVRILHKFPKLRFIFEHLSSKDGVDCLTSLANQGRRVFATITPQHMIISMNDVSMRYFRPRNFCMPHAKRRGDMEALRKLATSGVSYVGGGTDSAPHDPKNKESACCFAGVYSGPVATQVYTEVFDQRNALHNLAQFLYHNPKKFYGLPDQGAGELTLINESWLVPSHFEGIIPFKAGEELQWQVAL